MFEKIFTVSFIVSQIAHTRFSELNLIFYPVRENAEVFSKLTNLSAKLDNKIQAPLSKDIIHLPNKSMYPAVKNQKARNLLFISIL